MLSDPLSKKRPRTLSRRDFLKTGGAVAAAAALPLLLQACGGAAAVPVTSARSAPGGTHGVLPAYAPFQGPKADLPGLPNGTPPGFFTYPNNLTKSVSVPPGKGETISALAFTLFAPPPPVDQNPAWQQVSKELNANLTMTIVPVADYFTRVDTVVAGGDLPDIFVMSALGSTIQGEPQFLQQSAADLTPYLAGDGIKAYPNLANLPSYVWPSVGGLTGSALHTKQKLFDQAGIKTPRCPSVFPARSLACIRRPTRRRAPISHSPSRMGSRRSCLGGSRSHPSTIS